MGPNHVPTRNSLVYGFCNSLWSKTEEKSRRDKRDITHKIGSAGNSHFPQNFWTGYSLAIFTLSAKKFIYTNLAIFGFFHLRNMIQLVLGIFARNF